MLSVSEQKRVEHDTAAVSVAGVVPQIFIDCIRELDFMTTPSWRFKQEVSVGSMKTKFHRLLLRNKSFNLSEKLIFLYVLAIPKRDINVNKLSLNLNKTNS